MGELFHCKGGGRREKGDFWARFLGRAASDVLECMLYRVVGRAPKSHPGRISYSTPY